MKTGIAINPETKVSHIVPMLNHIDEVLVMSVKPGKGGQKFMEDVLYKVETLKELREANNYHYIISIDGGINGDTVKLAREAGVDMVVSGSYVCKSEDYNEKIKILRGE
jgi:ribulose-phosphate 3-epimerase